MYLPGSFREHRISKAHELICVRALGLLVGSGESGLQASPVSILRRPDEGEFGVLRAHLAQDIPHWRDLSGLDECKVVFGAPGGHLTRSRYRAKLETGKVVPTWT